jgi:hypothetical protein
VGSFPSENPKITPTSKGQGSTATHTESDKKPTTTELAEHRGHRRRKRLKTEELEQENAAPR